jgi:hypothetical protein
VTCVETATLPLPEEELSRHWLQLIIYGCNFGLVDMAGSFGQLDKFLLWSVQGDIKSAI